MRWQRMFYLPENGTKRTWHTFFRSVFLFFGAGSSLLPTCQEPKTCAILTTKSTTRNAGTMKCQVPSWRKQKTITNNLLTLKRIYTTVNRTRFLQFLGIYNQYQQPQFSFDASDLSSQSSPLTSCALPLFFPEKSPPNKEKVNELKILAGLLCNVKWENLLCFSCLHWIPCLVSSAQFEPSSRVWLGSWNLSI